MMVGYLLKQCSSVRIVNRISRIATRCFTLGDQAFHQPPLSALSSTFLPFNLVVDLASDLAIVLQAIDRCNYRCALPRQHVCLVIVLHSSKDQQWLQFLPRKRLRVSCLSNASSIMVTFFFSSGCKLVL